MILLIKFYIIKWYNDVYDYFTKYPDEYPNNTISKSELALQKDIDEYTNPEEEYIEQQLFKSDDK